jgi:CheY-like chemotaxis protein
MNKTMSIILAEDDPVNQKVTLLMLRKLGIQADAAANGLEVFETLEKQHYDIVLMDIQMLEMDGIEATKIIRERWACGPKIIVITDCDSNIYRELCFSAGANEFLAKPVMIEELTAAIEHSEKMAMLGAISFQ